MTHGYLQSRAQSLLAKTSDETHMFLLEMTAVVNNFAPDCILPEKARLCQTM